MGRTQYLRRAMALALAMALVGASGCGNRWSDEERAQVIARYQNRGSGDAGGGGNQQTSGASNGPTTTAAGSGGAVAGGGSAGGGGGGIAAGGGGASGPAPCAAPSDAPGVSADKIAIGNVSSLSGPVPGLGAGSVAAARAYVAYRNATGGVCGRQLELKTADDGTDNGRFRTLTDDIGKSVIGFAGQLGGGDAGGADLVEAQGIPVVATAISEQFQNAATVFDTNPPFENVNAVIGKYKYLYDSGIRTASIVYLGVDQTRSEILDKQKPQMEAAGITIVNQQELPLSTLSFDSAARGVANSKADYLLFLSAGDQNSSMARSMEDTGYELKSAEYLTAYGSNFIEVAGDEAAEGAVSWIRTLPNEEVTNTEQEAFLQWMGQVAPDVPPDTFAADAWSATKAFVDALAQLPGPITREALIAQLETFTKFDAGGFMGEINLGGKRTNGCFVAMKVVSGVWARLTPAQGFLC